MDEQTKQKRKDIVGWVIYIAVLLAIIITFRCFLMIGRVPSESMEPTLMVHDWLIGDRHAYEEEKPQRGDIVMFYQKDENETMVKRVIGLPGETVSFVGGKVYINGEPLDESAYLDDTVETDCGEEDKTFTVPEDSYFMLGDNRDFVNAGGSRMTTSYFSPASASFGSSSSTFAQRKCTVSSK